MAEVKFHVDEHKGWSYVVDESGRTMDGPYRYKWEAQERADSLNAYLTDGEKTRGSHDRA